MKIRKLATALVALLALGTAGCDLYPGTRWAFLQSVMLWNAIDSGDCVRVGSFTAADDLGSNPIDLKAKIRVTPQERAEYELMATGLVLQFVLFDVLSPVPLFAVDFGELKKGKGKASVQTPPLEIEEGDQIDAELCPSGEEGTGLPAGARVDLKVKAKVARELAFEE